MDTLVTAPTADVQDAWTAMHAQARGTAAWREMFDRGRRAAICQTRAETRTASQWTVRDLVLDLDADLARPLAQAAVKPTVVTLHADVVRIPKDVRLVLNGMALVIAARRIELAEPSFVRLDYRKSSSARLLVCAQEIAGAELTAMAVLGGAQVQRLPLRLPQAVPPVAGVLLHLVAGSPRLDPLAARPDAWFRQASQAWPLATSTFMMAVALMDAQPAVAASMLQHLVFCLASVPADAAQQSDWQELAQASAKLLQDGVDGVRAWAIDYGRQLFRGTPAAERRRRADELRRAHAASALANQHALVQSRAPAPDPAHLRYVRHGAQAAGLGRLNGLLQPLRSVSLTGAEVVLDAQDRSQFVQNYGGRTDIRTLDIHADTLVIKTGLRLPQTDVSIHCRSLYFEGPGAWIDVSPADEGREPPLTPDGADGTPGGSISLFIERFGSSEGGDARHLRLRGGSGQDAEDGGFDTARTARHLRPIDEKNDWTAVFSYDHRRVGAQTVDAPLWNDYKSDSVVYLELRIAGRKVASAGAQEEPGAGGPGLTAGRPGTGGPGGRLRSTLDEVFACADLRGGASGQPFGHSTGGAGGTPTQACWLTFDSQEQGGIHVLVPTREFKPAAWGPEAAAPGPQALAAEGEAGACEVLPAKPGERPWRTPLNLGLAVQFARDALADGHSGPAREMLVPYLAVSGEAATDALVLAPWSRQAAELAEQALRNVDAFGHPPGWVPRLSLGSTVQAYRSVLDGAMQELYTAYCLQRSWKDKADRQSGLQQLSALLTTQTQSSRVKLTSARAGMAPLVGELNQLLRETEDTGQRLVVLQQKLERQADGTMADAERKRILVESFRILGAVVKAIPLPEPYQAAAAGLGTLFDTAGNLIDDGSTAFTKLKAQVKQFGDEHTDALAELANQGLADAVLGADKDIVALQQQAATTQKALAAMAEEHEKACTAFKESAKQRAETHKAKREALIYGRAKSEDKEKLAREAGLLEKEFLKQEAEQKKKLDDGTRAYVEAEARLKRQQGDIEGRQKDLAELETTLADKKKDSAKSIEDGLQKVQNLVAGLDSINQSIGRLVVPAAQLNTQWDKALAQLKADDPEFKTIAAQLAYLQQRRTLLGNRLVQLQTDLATHKNQISTNLVAVHALSLQMARAHETLAPEVAVYAQALGQDAHRDLQRFLYFVVKAYEHQSVEAWGTSYHGAQALFDSMRNVLEPGDFRDVFVGDADADAQRKRLQELLDKPAAGPAGKLTPEEFKLLRVVYEKPLRDMGRQLLAQLMEGSSTQEAPSGITLRASQLQALNDRMARREAAAVPFDLVRLRQVDPRKDHQRIANIRVTRLRCRPLGERLPDRVALRFTLNGKSLVRAKGCLFAFDAEGDPSAAGDSGAALCFETYGGVGDQPGWQQDGAAALLQGKALWQPKPVAEENLLTQLLADDKDPNAGRLVALSGFRPGAYSDFVFSVDVSPAGTAIAIDEIDLLVTMEGRNAPEGEWVLFASADVPNMVPFRTDKPDRAGHQGGLGRYVGMFQGPSPVALSAPCEVDGLVHRGWLVDGEPVDASIEDGWSRITLSGNGYAQACYAAAPR